MPKQRGSRHPINALSVQFVRNAPPGFYCDGHGLNLRVDPSGARRWVQRLMIRGKSRTLGLGGFPLVSLAEARERAIRNRKLARAGGDPLAEKRQARLMPTFEEAVEHVVALHRPHWRNAKHAKDWPSSLRRHTFPRIGARPVSEVTSDDVLAVLTPIWHTRPETARRVRQRIGAVMKWAVAKGYRTDNPAGEAIGQALPRQVAEKRHMPALPYREVPGAIEAVRGSDASLAAKLAFEFLVLTAARSGETRLATWDEFDLEARVWTIPGERMKARRPHRVPLSERVLRVLGEARMLSGGDGLVFPGMKAGRPLSDMTLSKLLHELNIAAVPHGFRSSFRDWASELTDTPHAVMEAALAHTVKDKAEAAYARSDLFDRRRHLMDQWAAYLSAERGKVVSMVRPG